MKNNFFRLFVAFVVLFSMTGCGVDYQRAEGDGPGYSEQALRPDVFFVTYRGVSSQSRDTVRAQALYRASELTISRGYDYFNIVAGNEVQQISPWEETTVGTKELASGVPLTRIKIHLKEGEVPEDNPTAIDPSFYLDHHDPN